jgi:hypothetical protein
VRRELYTRGAAVGVRTDDLVSTIVSMYACIFRAKDGVSPVGAGGE